MARLPARLALSAIRAYQRYLSPIKGYCCALRAATGGDSCSAYGYRVIQRRGLLAGLRLLRRRLDMCALAGPHAAWRPPGALQRQQGFLDVGCDAPCDGAGCVHDLGIATDCLSPGCSACDCGWPWRRKQRLKEGKTEEMQKLQARIDARKRGSGS